MKRLLKISSVVAVALLVGLIGMWVVLGRADGPTGPIPGGELTTGAFADDIDVDWAVVLEGLAVAEIELQLLEPPGSRTTGAFVFAGDLYVPVDLGYVWRRVPNATGRRVLQLIWFFKRWHEDVLRDGRVVLRVHGKRYRRTAVRVTDPALLAKFRAHVSQAATEFMGELLPVETDPDEIWFFRLDPRAQITSILSDQ
jgi:hypothetical protein